MFYFIESLPSVGCLLRFHRSSIPTNGFPKYNFGPSYFAFVFKFTTNTWTSKGF